MRSLTRLGSDGDYHNQGGISSTMLKDWLTMSPAHWHAMHVARTLKPKSSDAFRLGNVAHTLLLEPFEFDERFVVLPEGHNGSTKAGKAMIKEIKESGREHVKHGEFIESEAMINAVLDDATVRRYGLFFGGQAEREFSTIHHTGLLLRCKPDYLQPGWRLDLKTTRKDTVADIKWDAIKRGYHISDVFYSNVLRATDIDVGAMIFVAVTKSQFPEVVAYRLDSDLRAQAETKIETALCEIAECLDKNEWPKLSQGIHEFGV